MSPCLCPLAAFLSGVPCLFLAASGTTPTLSSYRHTLMWTWFGRGALQGCLNVYLVLLRYWRERACSPRGSDVHVPFSATNARILESGDLHIFYPRSTQVLEQQVCTVTKWPNPTDPFQRYLPSQLRSDSSMSSVEVEGNLQDLVPTYADKLAGFETLSLRVKRTPVVR